jgi:hypothetical protein
MKGPSKDSSYYVCKLDTIRVGVIVEYLGEGIEEVRVVRCIPVGVGEWRLIWGYLSNQQTNPVRRNN